MNNLQPESLAVHHPRTSRDLKKERPGQAHLLVSKNNIKETVTAQKQAISTRLKISEHFAHDYTKKKIPKQASSAHRKINEQNAHYLLSIYPLRILLFEPADTKCSARTTFPTG